MPSSVLCPILGAETLAGLGPLSDNQCSEVNTVPKLCRGLSFKGHRSDPFRGTQQLQVRGVEGGLSPPPHLASQDARERGLWETAGAFAQEDTQAPLLSPLPGRRVKSPAEGRGSQTS